MSPSGNPVSKCCFSERCVIWPHASPLLPEPESRVKEIAKSQRLPFQTCAPSLEPAGTDLDKTEKPWSQTLTHTAQGNDYRAGWEHTLSKDLNRKH